VHIFDAAGREILESSVKILQRDPSKPIEALTITKLPSPIVPLSEDHCSLGQDMKYYETFLALGPETYTPYFAALRDAAVNPDIAAVFQEMEGFRKSLLRFSEAEKAFHEARSLFTDQPVESNLKFTFRSTVPGAIAPHEVSFDFSEHPTGLHRVCVIIGRNGTGKTQFLAQFAGAMSGWNTESPDYYRFLPRRPGFSKVIAVSYSVFDDFNRPSEDSRTFSYKYCGIRSPDISPRTINRVAPPSQPDSGARFLSPTQLKERLLRAHTTLRSQDREGRWKDILSILLEATIELSEESLDTLSFYDRLSSGQRILVAIMTEIVANISKQSVILFDEPELHLHPEVFAALARALDRLLHEFDSYAIIATHSSLLLQETLAKQVRVFRRQGNSPIVAPLTVESFGENLSLITSQVFAVDCSLHNFRSHLDGLRNGRTSEEVEALFPMGLPLQAQAYLKSLEATES